MIQVPTVGLVFQEERWVVVVEGAGGGAKGREGKGRGGKGREGNAG